MSSDTYEYQSEFARKYFAQRREEARREGYEEGYREGYEEGYREGWSRALLVVLEARGVQIDEETHQRIGACRELDQLKRWLRKAVSARSMQELFEPAPTAEKKSGGRALWARLIHRAPQQAVRGGGVDALVIWCGHRLSTQRASNQALDIA